MGLFSDAVSGVQNAADSVTDAAGDATDTATDTAGDAAGGTVDLGEWAYSGATDATDNAVDGSTDWAGDNLGPVGEYVDWIDETPKNERWGTYSTGLNSIITLGGQGDPQGDGYLAESYSIFDNALGLGYLPGGGKPVGRPLSVAGDVGDFLTGSGAQNGGQSGGGGSGLPTWLLPVGLAAAGVVAVVAVMGEE